MGINPKNLKKILPSIPLVHSLLFPVLQNAETFGNNSSVADQLHAQGFALIDLSRERMTRLAMTIRESLESHFDLHTWRVVGGKADLRLQDAWKDVVEVKTLALYPIILEILECVYGRRPFAFQTLNFPVGSQQHLHSNAVNFHSELAGFMCGVWVALEDIHVEAGPLEYVPGSHRLPYLQAHDVAVDSHPEAKYSPAIFHEAWLSMMAVQNLHSQIFAPRLGQALIWSANLLHGGTAVVNTKLTRWSQVTHYFFEGCRYYTPMLSRWPDGPVAWRQPFNIETGKSLDSNSCEKIIQNKDINQTLEQRLVNFDPEAFLAIHSDVASAGVNAYEHLIRHGLQEGREW